MNKNKLTDLISALFIVLFLYAAVSKLVQYEKFVIQLSQSPMLTAISRQVSWVIPALEIAIALVLISSRFRLTGLYAGYTLMVIFTTYIIVITRYGTYIPCSCGGVLSKMSWNQHLIFNLVFVALGIAGVLLEPSRNMQNRSRIYSLT